MIKSVFLILFGVHLLGDFYFQTQKMADRKRIRFSGTLFHSAVYAVTAWILCTVFIPGMQWSYILAFALAHALIDALKYGLCRFFRSRKFPVDERKVFLADQGTHIVTIAGIAGCMRNLKMTELSNTGISALFEAFDIPGMTVVRWAVVLLLIHKPANILISNILSGYRPSDKTNPDVNDRNAGRMIGTLERIIMTIFLSISQYSAVGLVLTAKSIARYDRISKDQAFAEYYLLGTLLSTIVSIVVSLLFLA